MTGALPVLVMNHTVLTIALLFAPFFASAATLNSLPLNHPVPVIPHGLNWSILTSPLPEIPALALSYEEVRLILPRVIELGQIERAGASGSLASSRDETHANPFLFILVGIVFLLAAYDLIPRAQTQILRFRSVDLDRDLFS